MVRNRIIIVLVLISALCLGLLSIAFPLLVISVPSLTYFFSGARVMVEDLGLPDDVRDVSEISVSAADGPAPETARRSFFTRMPAEDIRRFYLDRCAGLEMTVPPEGWFRASPEIICAEIGTDPTGPRAHLYLDCDEAACLVTIEVRI